jgi:hypothetical protein
MQKRSRPGSTGDGPERIPKPPPHYKTTAGKSLNMRGSLITRYALPLGPQPSASLALVIAPGGFDHGE